MKRYIAVLELDDDEEIVGDANISYTYRSNGTNYGTDESVELKADTEEQSAIQINDFDTPIEVAQKIINGTMEVEAQQSLYESGANDTWECVRKLSSEISGETIKSIFDAPYCEVFKRFTASEAMAKVKEYEEKQKEPVFKIGDRVRTLVEKDNMGTVRFPVGTIGEVTDFDGNAIEVSVDEKKWYYHKKDIELANDVIVVGDEVWLLDENYHGVVTAVWDDCGVVKTERLTQSGKLACDDAKDLHRTGRRFPEIANILKQMQEVKE